MKVYPDANIYITYLLGQKGEQLSDRFFKQGIGCRFSIVASNTMFAEVAQRCGESGKILLQKNIEDFKKVKKLEIIERTPEELREAIARGIETDQIFGRNDMLHSVLARNHSDVFVTDDKSLAKISAKTQIAMSLEDFVESEL